jgi:hypothetical protein
MPGGEMWLESEPGKGSRFHFTARMEASKLARSSRPLLPHAPPVAQVLVVDDNQTNRRMLLDTLTTCGADVWVAESASHAFAARRQRASTGKPVTLLVTGSHKRRRHRSGSGRRQRDGAPRERPPGGWLQLQASGR